MRRSEKAVTEATELDDIIRSGQICHLAMAAEPAPYIVPLNYGYQTGTLYFHSAGEGRKIDLLRQNQRVGFEISLDLGIVEGKHACSWGAKYRSVIGHGRIEFIDELEQKQQALDLIMAQYSDGNFTYTEKSLQGTTIFKLIIDELSGKQSRT